jgi:hypothetical protein
MIRPNYRVLLPVLIIALAVIIGLVEGLSGASTKVAKNPDPPGSGIASSRSSVPSKLGVVRNGHWLLRSSLTEGPNTVPTFVFGRPDDIPVMGDWNGDGTQTAGVVRATDSGMQWFLRNSNNSGPADISFFYGSPDSKERPVVGDWNGDGIDTPGVVGRTLPRWDLRNSNSGGAADVSFYYGLISDGLPVPGDWNGDGTDSAGIIRGFAGPLNWLLRNSNTPGLADISAVFGSGFDQPVIGDWDGDGDDELGVTQPVGGGLSWYLRDTATTGPVDRGFVYGRPTDLPVVWR